MVLGMIFGMRQTLRKEKGGIEQTMTTVMFIEGLQLGLFWRGCVPSVGFNSIQSGIGFKGTVDRQGRLIEIRDLYPRNFAMD